MTPRLFPALLLATALGVIVLGFFRPDRAGAGRAWVRAVGEAGRDASRAGALVLPVSAKAEREAGLRLLADLSRGTRVTEGAEDAAYAAGVGAFLLRHLDAPRFAYRFAVLERPEEVNAFALPGGIVCATRGLLRALGSEAELAGILAHEIAHVELGHTAEVAREVRLGRALGGILTILQRGYSEEREREADGWGMDLARRAGYHPEGLLEFLSVLTEFDPVPRRPSTGSPQRRGLEALRAALEEYRATHPPAGERIARLQARLRADQAAWLGREFYRGRRNWRERVPRIERSWPEEWIAAGPELLE